MPSFLRDILIRKGRGYMLGISICDLEYLLQPRGNWQNRSIFKRENVKMCLIWFLKTIYRDTKNSKNLFPFRNLKMHSPNHLTSWQHSHSRKSINFQNFQQPTDAQLWVNHRLLRGFQRQPAAASRLPWSLQKYHTAYRQHPRLLQYHFPPAIRLLRCLQW